MSDREMQKLSHFAETACHLIEAQDGSDEYRFLLIAIDRQGRSSAVFNMPPWVAIEVAKAWVDKHDPSNTRKVTPRGTTQ